MTTRLSAMKQALGCLVRASAMYGQPNEDVQQALRAAIQEAEQQEPVGWTTKGQLAAMDNGFNHYIQARVPRFVTPTDNDVPLYTQPPAAKKWQGLTDEEIEKVHETQIWDARRSYARAIEAKLKERNA